MSDALKPQEIAKMLIAAELDDSIPKLDDGQILSICESRYWTVDDTPSLQQLAHAFFFEGCAAQRRREPAGSAEPIAYMTTDKRMMIFADALNGSPDGMTPLYGHPAGSAGKERELFEQWALSADGGFTKTMIGRDENGDYIEIRPADLWSAWQARAALATAPAPMTDEQIFNLVAEYEEPDNTEDGIWRSPKFTHDGILNFARAVLAAQGKPAFADKQKRIGGEMAKMLFDLAQQCGYTLDSDDCAIFDNLRKQWDAAQGKQEGEKG